MLCILILLLIQSDLTVFLQVNIQVPAPEQQSDKIAITGLANHLDRAKEGLLERVKELQAEQEDRVSIMHRTLPFIVSVFRVEGGVTCAQLFSVVY